MDFYDDESINSLEKRDVAFAAIRGLREAITIGRRTQQPTTYEQTLDLLYSHDPELYTRFAELLDVRNESDLVKYFKQKASLSQEPTSLFSPTPESLIKEEVTELEKLLEKATKSEDVRHLQRRMFQLKGALKYFLPRRVSEHRILENDFYKAQHPFFSKDIYEGDRFKDYKLPDNRVLRLRLLHPDKEEHILGADLIYEMYDVVNEQVRFVHMQYKTWEKGVLYLNSGNVKSQIQKMQGHLCSIGFCNDHQGNNHSGTYRLPHCCGFLRPTEKLQKMSTRLISSGIHLPLCEVAKHFDTDGKISKSNAKGKNLSSKVFTDLFINNVLGSRWISMTVLEKYYQERDIDDLQNRIRIHAQEIPVVSAVDYTR